MGLSSHQSARMKNDEWLTPPWVLEQLGPFDLDPCCPISMPWRTAAHVFTKEDDGLSRGWFGRVWLNPPFGRQVGAWLKRMTEHGNGIALVAARTETQWFVEHIWEAADAVLFLFGRPHFHYVNGEPAKANSGAPICLVAYGSGNVQALASCNLAGRLVEL